MKNQIIKKIAIALAIAIPSFIVGVKEKDLEKIANTVVVFIQSFD